MLVNKNNKYITTTINTNPNINEIILTDIIVRYYRLFNNEVFFLTGFVDDNYKSNEIEKYLEINQNMLISNNDFIKTTSQQHKEIVKEFYLRCKKDIYIKDNIIKDKYFKLNKYKNDIIKWLSNNNIIYPSYYQLLIIKKLKENDILNDICISTNNKYFFNELICYISGNISGYPVDINIINKKYLWNHVVIWTGLLMSAKLALPKKIFVNSINSSLKINNYLIVEDLLKKYNVSTIRYFILREYKHQYKIEDISYLETKIINYHNKELLSKFSNLVLRSINLVKKYNNNIIPMVKSNELFSINELIKNIETNLNEFRLDLIIKNILHKIKILNKYISIEQPWKNNKNIKIIIKTVLDGIYILSNLLLPIIPDIIEKIFVVLMTPPINVYYDLKWGILHGNVKIGNKLKLFKKI